jgi:hypothetical protein
MTLETNTLRLWIHTEDLKHLTVNTRMEGGIVSLLQEFVSALYSTEYLLNKEIVKCEM